ncbi:penicillin-binding protein 2 [Erwinia sp. OLTSP20]|uniref:penicillin-binding protein 2 n=1 Tax=unclassified Erwinia TaxID=2622719 RepID=UPI000C184111|nr:MULTISPECIES: penicillin-binding protein 2 [unclassified Erwinia]PIJ50321.1 penicillin-binding protein 2 [Erwinia sp. OAMSP11]PIJ72158.1 penicillin-binding protein 2 [Erwinia sp. OLSSP12]PIJ81449.1 penicillin-binding protein 2 [Erwinia sp. OLCASP19]PIJ84155.1 penicillin-binding protein 2 [Erwinia sp. OLMTSP26]PIJ85854.1 penicillin-binding protein 2 [Erwinia sp. OLMDSP33]
MKLPDFEQQEKLFIRRAFTAFTLVLCGFIVLIMNLWHLQIEDSQYYQTRSDQNAIKMIPLAPTRGIIYDRHGTPLVKNIRMFDLSVMPYKIHNMAALVKALTPIIYLTPDDISTFWHTLSRSSRYRPVVLKNQLNSLEMARFAVNQFKFSGVSIESYFQRQYPYGAALSHVLGYVSRINAADEQRLIASGQQENYLADRNIGKQGIEGYYESLLHGKTGYQEVEVDNRSRIVRVLKEVPPVAGKNLYLTLDLPLQLFVTRQLQGQRAAVLIENPQDASVLAMVSCPGYDPNPFVKGISYQAYHQLLADPGLPLINRVTQGLYPPASTVKPYMAMAALLDNVISPQTTFYGGAQWTLPGTRRRYRDWKKSGHGVLNVSKAIEESADTFFYQVAFEMGIDRIHTMLSQFGYGQLTGIDLHEEYPGLLPSRRWKKRAHHQPWYQGDTISVGIGQGYWTATPIQMVKALVTLLNNGRVMTPHLRYAIRSGRQVSDYRSPAAVGQIASASSPYWALVRQAMFGMANAPNGTGYKYFHSARYGIAAKSGTAQVFGLKQNQAYNARAIPLRLRDHIFYTAFAPYQHPAVAMALILENGGDHGVVAGQVVRHILDFMFQPETTKPRLAGAATHAPRRLVAGEAA